MVYIVTILSFVHVHDLKRFFFSRTKAEQDEFAKVNLRDLSIIKTLGVGGFGRVELVSVSFVCLMLTATIACFS